MFFLRICERGLTKVCGYRLVVRCAGGLDMSLPRPGLLSDPGQRVLSRMIDYIERLRVFLPETVQRSKGLPCAEVVAETANQGQRD